MKCCSFCRLFCSNVCHSSVFLRSHEFSRETCVCVDDYDKKKREPKLIAIKPHQRISLTDIGYFCSRLYSTYLSYKHAESSCDCDKARLYRPSDGESTNRYDATRPNITTDPFCNKSREKKQIEIN